MSSYLNDNDAGDVQLDFKNAGGTILGSAIISDPDFGPNNVWSPEFEEPGLCPWEPPPFARRSLERLVNGGADGYIDNVDVQLTTCRACC